jgi:hypothetical protein
MSDEQQRQPDEEEKVSEDAVLDTSEEDPGEDDEGMVTAEELRAEVHDIGTRVKTAGLKPFRQMVRMYVDQTLDAVDGLLSALEGSKRKKGD